MPLPFKFKINKAFISLSFRPHKFKFHVYEKYLNTWIFAMAYEGHLMNGDKKAFN